MNTARQPDPGLDDPVNLAFDAGDAALAEAMATAYERETGSPAAEARYFVWSRFPELSAAAEREKRAGHEHREDDP